MVKSSQPPRLPSLLHPLLRVLILRVSHTGGRPEHAQKQSPTTTSHGVEPGEQKKQEEDAATVVFRQPELHKPRPGDFCKTAWLGLEGELLVDIVSDECRAPCTTLFELWSSFRVIRGYSGRELPDTPVWLRRSWAAPIRSRPVDPHPHPWSFSRVLGRCPGQCGGARGAQEPMLFGPQVRASVHRLQPSWASAKKRHLGSPAVAIDK